MARKNPVRRKKRRTSYPQAGVSPGSYRPDPQAWQSAVHVFAYGPDECRELQPRRLADVQPLLGAHPVVWVNIDGLADLELIDQLEQVFGLHRLTVDDIVNVGQRVKSKNTKMVLYCRSHERQDNPLRTEQISLFLAAGLVITVQERPGDRFDPPRTVARQPRPLAQTGRRLPALRAAGHDHRLALPHARSLRRPARSARG
jgi:magnesium transporter